MKVKGNGLRVDIKYRYRNVKVLLVFGVSK